MNYHNNMKPTQEQILSALNEMIQNKTELKELLSKKKS